MGLTAEEFVARLHHTLLVDHLAMYEQILRAAKDPTVVDGLADLDDEYLDDEPSASAFLASLTAEQEAGYLHQVRNVMAATASTILATLDGDDGDGDGDDGDGFRLVPAGGADIAGELHELFVRRELALAGFRTVPDEPEDSAGPDGPAGSDPASIGAEEFIDRVQEVLDDDVRAYYAAATTETAGPADDPTVPARGTASDFLTALTDEQREAHLSLIGYAISGTAATILGILDGATATRTDYVRFAVIPPGGADISGDLQELLMIAEEDGPFGGTRS